MYRSDRFEISFQTCSEAEGLVINSSTTTTKRVRWHWPSLGKSTDFITKFRFSFILYSFSWYKNRVEVTTSCTTDRYEWQILLLAKSNARVVACRSWATFFLSCVNQSISPTNWAYCEKTNYILAKYIPRFQYVFDRMRRTLTTIQI